MSTHIGAKQGDIAERILLPGDPLRAKFIAETYLENPVCYNNVRGMLGFTGTYRGKRVSVQGTGMGVPSISIYVNELIREYGCKTLIRTGTCGCFDENIKVLDVILAQGASTTSAINNCVFGANHYAPIADFSLLHTAYAKAGEKGLKTYVGNVLTSDRFYNEEGDESWKQWKAYGVMGVEMECAALYSIAARYGAKALGILTVSDHIVTGEVTSSETRERALKDMIELGLETAIEH